MRVYDNEKNAAMEHRNNDW